MKSKFGFETAQKENILAKTDSLRKQKQHKTINDDDEMTEHKLKRHNCKYETSYDTRTTIDHVEYEFEILVIHVCYLNNICGLIVIYVFQLCVCVCVCVCVRVCVCMYICVS